MILKALYDYYHRCGDLAPSGFKEMEIPFLIVIDKEGNFMRVEDMRIDKKTSQKFLVVAGSRSSGIKPYLMYDNLEYVLCHTKDGKEEKSILKHQAFVNQCKALAETYSESDAFKAVSLFFEKGGVAKVKEDSLWNDMVKKTGANVSFILQGETEIIASAKELQSEVDASVEDSNEVEWPCCLITGEHAQPVETTTATMIPGSQATAKLVAFQVSSGYDSYGKSKGNNAPISKYAESAYTTALLHLLGKQSRNKFYIGNRTFLFWASSNNDSAKAVEESLFSMFGFADTDTDDPNRRIEEVRKTFQSIYSGELPCDSTDKFYILGLAPNSARIAVVYWNEIKLRDFSKMILKHFDDMEIIDGRKEKRPYYGLRQMMSAVTLGGKASEVQPNLPEMTIKSIFQGLPYPYTLFSSSIRRIRAEQADGMQIARIAILKAYLNRTKSNNNKSLTIMLDKENKNLGYVCGRLFAVLEYAQKRANNITSVKERYMNAASATPAAVFPTLLNLNTHHVEKLENEGVKIYIENMKQEIVAMLPSDGFPSHLSLQDQGRFFIGYYHQMQDIYTKKESKSE